MPGYGVVRETRRLPLVAGVNTLRITDVAAGIDPTTVSFRSLTDPAARVLDQTFEYDLIAGPRLLQKYLDKRDHRHAAERGGQRPGPARRGRGCGTHGDPLAPGLPGETPPCWCRATIARFPGQARG